MHLLKGMLLNNYMRIEIQPKELKDKTLPYPYFIDKNALVGRQDFWRGKPYRLLGFSCKARTGEMDIMFKDFWKNPKLALEKYPVFSDNKDNWTTLMNKIQSINKLK